MNKLLSRRQLLKMGGVVIVSGCAPSGGRDDAGVADARALDGPTSDGGGAWISGDAGADDTVWLGGQGGWDEGDFSVLDAVVRSIDPAGGWAPLPNTRLADVLLTQARAQEISPYIWGTQGSSAIVEVWGGAAFNGRSFLLGSGGGHFSYFGNELYRIRLTGTPQAIRMYDPPPVSYVADPAMFPSTFCANPWGPVGCHHYDQWRWDPSHPNEYWMSGANCNSWNGAILDGRIWRFDVDAPTPRAAWSHISLTERYGHPARDGACLFIGPDGRLRYHQGGHPSDWWDQVVDRETMSLSPAAGFPSPGWAGSWYDQPLVHRLDASTYFAPQRYPSDAPYGSPAMQLLKKAGSDTPESVWAPMPAWFNTSADFDRLGGVANDGRRIVIWNGGGPVAVLDTATNLSQEFTPTGSAPVPTTGSGNGVWGRWAYVPEVRAFVGLSRAEEDLWVFRPPASWGVGG